MSNVTEHIGKVDGGHDEGLWILAVKVDRESIVRIISSLSVEKDIMDKNQVGEAAKVKNHPNNLEKIKETVLIIGVGIYLLNLIDL